MSSEPRRGPRVTQKGMALIAVVSVVSFVAVVTAEFSYNTNIDMAQAGNARDDMRAYFLARSGMNLARLIVKVQKDILDKKFPQIQPDLYAPLILSAFGGSKEEAKEFAASLGGVDVENVKGLGLPAGEFGVEFSSDDGKINVNCGGSRTAATQKQVELMLTALVLPPAYDRMFEERDGDGQFTDRATFIKAIIDYVDPDNAGYGSNGGTEDYGYEMRPEPYKARDNYLDSVDELRLVRGMDERRWGLFGPAFTIYGGCKVNLNASNDLNVIMAIIAQGAKDPNDPVLRDINKLWRLAGAVAQAPGYGQRFKKLEDFVKFVKDPAASVFDGLPPEIAEQLKPKTQDPSQQLVQGIDLDLEKVKLIARVGGRRTYRVVSSSKIGLVEKKIVGVFDSDTTNQNARDPAYSKGTWVYWREE